MNIHMHENLSGGRLLPFDENQGSVGMIRKSSGMKHSLQNNQNDSAGFPVKPKDLGISASGTAPALKKQRKALGSISESQINSRLQSTHTINGNVKRSKDNFSDSLTKPNSAKLAPTEIFIENSYKKEVDSTDDMMTCSNQKQQRDLYLEVDRMAAKRFSSSKPGLSCPSKNTATFRKSFSSSLNHPGFQENIQVATDLIISGKSRSEAEQHIVTDMCSDNNKGDFDFYVESSNNPFLLPSDKGSFLSDIFDDEAINDLLKD